MLRCELSVWFDQMCSVPVRDSGAQVVAQSCTYVWGVCQGHTLFLVSVMGDLVLGVSRVALRCRVSVSVVPKF